MANAIWLPGQVKPGSAASDIFYNNNTIKLPVVTNTNKTNTAPTPTTPTQSTSSSSSSYSARQSYLDKIIALQNEQRAREEAERQRIRDERINAANAAYDTGVNNLNRATTDAQQQAYIQMMKEKKAMPQQLQALGISGGATESTLAGINSAYGTNRTNIDKARLEQLGLLEQDRAEAIAAANADLANANISAERDYTQGLIDTYMSAMPSYSSSSSSSTSQSSTSSAGYKYANSLLNNGYTAQEINEELSRQGYSEAQIARYLYDLGLL